MKMFEIRSVLIDKNYLEQEKNMKKIIGYYEKLYKSNRKNMKTIEDFNLYNYVETIMKKEFVDEMEKHKKILKLIESGCLEVPLDFYIEYKKQNVLKIYGENKDIEILYKDFNFGISDTQFRSPNDVLVNLNKSIMFNLGINNKEIGIIHIDDKIRIFKNRNNNRQIFDEVSINIPSNKGKFEKVYEVDNMISYKDERLKNLLKSDEYLRNYQLNLSEFSLGNIENIEYKWRDKKSVNKAKNESKEESIEEYYKLLGYLLSSYINKLGDTPLSNYIILSSNKLLNYNIDHLKKGILLNFARYKQETKNTVESKNKYFNLLKKKKNQYINYDYHYFILLEKLFNKYKTFSKPEIDLKYTEDTKYEKYIRINVLENNIIKSIQYRIKIEKENNDDNTFQKIKAIKIRETESSEFYYDEKKIKRLKKVYYDRAFLTSKQISELQKIKNTEEIRMLYLKDSYCKEMMKLNIEVFDPTLSYIVKQIPKYEKIFDNFYEKNLKIYKNIDNKKALYYISIKKNTNDKIDIKIKMVEDTFYRISKSENYNSIILTDNKDGYKNDFIEKEIDEVDEESFLKNSRLGAIDLFDFKEVEIK